MSLRRTLKPSEHQEQKAVIDWWRLACKGYGLPEYVLFSIPNGAHLAGDSRLRAIKMANLKKTGLRPGIPDLFLAIPEPRFPGCGLFIEMKVKPNKPSAEQAKVIADLRAASYGVSVCYSADEAVETIKDYLYLK